MLYKAGKKTYRDGCRARTRHMDEFYGITKEQRRQMPLDERELRQRRIEKSLWTEQEAT